MQQQPLNGVVNGVMVTTAISRTMKRRTYCAALRQAELPLLLAAPAAVLLLLQLLAGASTTAAQSVVASCTVTMQRPANGAPDQETTIVCTSAGGFQPQFYVSTYINTYSTVANSCTGCNMTEDASLPSGLPALHYNGTSSSGSSSAANGLLVENSWWHNLEASSQGQLLLVSGGVSLTLRTSTFSNNRLDNETDQQLVLARGGSTLVLDQCTFDTNHVQGRALVTVEGSNLRVQDSLFQHSEGDNRAVLFYQGGSNTADINSSVFSNLPGGALEFRAVDEASTVLVNAAPVVVRHSSFSACAANDAGQLHGGAVLSWQLPLLVYDCGFSENTASWGWGGAVFAARVPAVVVREAGFSNNSASTTDGYGGAVLVWEAAADSAAYSTAGLDAEAASKWTVAAGVVLDIKDVSFTGNMAARGGAVAVLDSTGGVKVSSASFDENWGVIGSGGGISVNSSQPSGNLLDVSSCSFTANRATRGGGLVVYGTGGVQISACGFTGNRAEAGSGGAVRLEDVASSSDPVNITGVTFTNNWATDRGGGMAIYAADVPLIYLYQTTFTANTASTSRGGAFMADLYGQRSYDSGPPIIIQDSTFTSNTAAARGGAVYTAGHPLTLLSCTLTDNLASGSVALGGAVYSKEGAWFKVSQGSFTRNSAPDSGQGGALYVLDTAAGWTAPHTATTALLAALSEPGEPTTPGVAVQLQSGLYNSNWASYGGGVVVTNTLGGLQVGDATFTNNTATTGSGGGMVVRSHQPTTPPPDISTDPGFYLFEITSTTFGQNSAGGQAGGLGLFGIDMPRITISDTSFSQNQAVGEGGGIAATAYNSLPSGGNTGAPPIVLSTASFGYNTGSYGGGMFTDTYPITASGTFWMNNAATDASTPRSGGGAVYAATVRWFKATGNCNFDGNNAHAGGAVLIAQGAASYTYPYPGANTTGLLPTTDGVQVEVVDGFFQANVASGDAGGAMLLSSLVGSVEITTTMIRTNSALNGNAGGLLLEGSYQSDLPVTISSTTFEYNTAANGAGGAVVIADCGAPLFRFVSCGITNNVAEEGGALFLHRGAASGDLSPVVVVSTTLQANTASTGGGGAILTTGFPLAVVTSTLSSNTAATRGAGIHAYGTAWVKVVSSQVYSNELGLSNSGGAGVSSEDYSGGVWAAPYPSTAALAAVYAALPSAAGTRLELLTSQFIDLSGERGGAVAVDGGTGGVVVKGCYFNGCTADGENGGAILLSNLSTGGVGVSISGTNFRYCYALGRGGALLLSGVTAPKLALSHTRFRDNGADSGAGLALYNSPGVQRLELRNCSFVDNQAAKHGMAVSVTVDNAGSDDVLLDLPAPPPVPLQLGAVYTLNLQGCSGAVTNVSQPLRLEERMRGMTMGVAPRVGAAWGDCRYTTILWGTPEPQPPPPPPSGPDSPPPSAPDSSPPPPPDSNYPPAVTPKL